MAKKKQPAPEEVLAQEEAVALGDVPVAEASAEVPEQEDATLDVVAAVPEAVEEVSQADPPAEAVAEVEALPLEDIPDVVEEPAPAPVAVEEAEALDIGAVDARCEEQVPVQEPAQAPFVDEAVETPVAVAVAVAPEGGEGEVKVKDAIQEENVQEAAAPAQMDAEVQAPAAYTVLPDYNERLMRRERMGYAGSFRLAEGEQVLSMYRALKGSGTGGRVYLTNERCLIEAALHTEFPIQKVAGISAGSYSRLKVFKFLIGLFLMVACVACVLLALPDVLVKILPGFADTMRGVFEDMGWLRYVLFGVGGLMGFIGFIMACTSGVHRFVLTVYTEGVDQAFSVRSGVNKGDYNVYQPIAFGAPGRDYKAFISQVGARLVEIKRAKGDK